MKMHLPILASALVMASLTTSYSATIAHVTTDSSTGRDWRTSGTVKPNDVDGDNIYGTHGYRIASFGNANDISQPGWASYSVVVAGFEGPGNEAHQSSFDDVTQTGVGPVPDVIAGDFWTGGAPNGTYQLFFTITLTAPASFRLGVISDQTNFNPPGVINESSDGVRITGPGGATAENVGPAKDGVPDYYLFDVTGTTGEVFEIYGRNAPNWTENALGGFFIDQIPEPSGSLLGLLGCFGLALRRRR